MSRIRFLLLLVAAATSLTAREPVTAPAPGGTVVFPPGGNPGADHDTGGSTIFTVRDGRPGGAAAR